MDELETAPVKKQAAVLSDASLLCLAQDLGELTLRVAMYLNVPTLRLIQLQIAARERNWEQEDLTSRMLLAWKQQREGAKEKDKVLDLMRALRDNDKPDHADVVADKHKDDAELSAGCFR